MSEFPMPGDKLLNGTVIASVHYDDTGEFNNHRATVIVLNDVEPFYTVAVVYWTRHPIEVETVAGMYGNIVPAVDEYQQWGGDV